MGLAMPVQAASWAAHRSLQLGTFSSFSPGLGFGGEIEKQDRPPAFTGAAVSFAAQAERPVRTRQTQAARQRNFMHTPHSKPKEVPPKELPSGGLGVNESPSDDCNGL